MPSLDEQPLEASITYGDEKRRQRQQSLLFIGIGLLLSMLAGLELLVTLNTGGGGGESRKFPDDDDAISFLVVGDWGRRGTYNQSRVADAMAAKATQEGGVGFVVSTGDNFYESGLVSVEDDNFTASFSNIYHHKSLQVPWYVVLGNHDYGEFWEPGARPTMCPDGENFDSCYFSPLHQLDVRLKDRDWRWNCKRSYTMTFESKQSGRVDMFFIDTTPILDSKYSSAIWADNIGGLREQDWRSQVEELEVSLASSTAPWKIVVGHHPVRSNHIITRQFEDMVAVIEPLLIRYNVSAYFCGHDHNLQHIHASSYHQIVSGAGSELGKGFFSHHHSPFQYDENGFVFVRIDSNHEMSVEYLGLSDDENKGNPVSLFSIKVT